MTSIGFYTDTLIMKKLRMFLKYIFGDFKNKL